MASHKIILLFRAYEAERVFARARNAQGWRVKAHNLPLERLNISDQ